MKIASSSLEMASSHFAMQKREVRESLRSWVGNAAPEARQAPPSLPDPVQLSDTGKAAQQSEAAEDDALTKDPKLALLRTLIKFFTGKKIELLDASELQKRMAQATEGNEALAELETMRQAPAGYGVEYDYRSRYSEQEETHFTVSGAVRTADGKTVQFDLSLSMQRSYAEESSVRLRLGDAARKKDPLVLNFGGNAAQLTNTRFQFDLDADGRMDSINFVAGGSGFLVFDRNRDGKANDGRELFGPGTGNGFQELAALDQDGNGWIDEGDAAYADLRIWTKDASGNDVLRSLKDANVGAIALANVATPFDLKDGNNRLQGEVRASGIFLREDGQVGSVQQIDLTV